VLDVADDLDQDDDEAPARHSARNGGHSAYYDGA
jgi:hypothetical protein